VVNICINGVWYERLIEPRKLLSDFIRHDAGLTGTHVGCEHGACGACTVFLNGETVRSCLLLAVQADNQEIETIEALSADGELDPIQQAFIEEMGLQCGFCTPGMVLTVKEFLKDNPDPDESEIREAVSGNLCRCTGYHNIVLSVGRAAELLKESRMERQS
jgi:aerobic-type carbon monoxide dehydrogenase small subunit (CoxS/CutS family)